MNLIWKIMWPELRPYRGKLLLVLFTGVLVSAFKASIPWLMGQLFDAWRLHDPTMAMRLPLVVAAAWILSSPLRYYHMYGMLYISELIAVNLRRRLMNKYLT